MHGFIAALAKAGTFVLKIAKAAFGALKGLEFCNFCWHHHCRVHQISEEDDS